MSADAMPTTLRTTNATTGAAFAATGTAVATVAAAAHRRRRCHRYHLVYFVCFSMEAFQTRCVIALLPLSLLE